MIVYHVFPENDIEPHELTGYLCQCEPRIEYDQNDGTVLVIHHSFDGRELIEQANEILKNGYK